jgi:arginyl-tRNA--protein-N-Asp/Glu arginylyltransferase
MSRIRIDPAAIQTAERAVATAEAELVTAKETLSQQESRMETIRWAQQQAAYEYHNNISGSGLYMTAYGSSRSHMNKCNAAMDWKQSVDQKYRENIEDCQRQIREASRVYDRAAEKVCQAKEDLTHAQRGF